MKIKIFLELLLIGLLAGSCLKDDSAENVKLFNPLVIKDFASSETIYIPQGERLKMKVLAYKEGTDDAKLAFEWRLEGHGQHLDLGHAMMLDTIINVPMERDSYSLLFKVTDTEYDLILTKKYNLYVTGQYEAGLLVADTRDELTSDIHLVNSLNFTQDYAREEEKHVFYNIYSLNNGTKIDGFVRDMKNVVGRGFLVLSVATDHSIEDLDPLDNFSVMRRNNEMFVKPFEGEISIGKMESSGIGPYDIVSVNGRIFKRYQYEESITYGVGLTLDDLTDDYYISDYKYRPSSPRPMAYEIFGIAFDQKNKRFLAFPSYRLEDNLRIFRHTSEDKKWDPNKVGNKDCKYIGYAPNNTMYAVLQDNVTKAYDVWVFNMNSDDNTKDDVVIGHYYLDRCPDIEKAVSFSSQGMENVLYYATENSVYTALMTSEYPVAYPKFSAEPGEKITEIRVVDRCPGKVVVPDDGNEVKTVPSSQNMITIVTYNEAIKEGKVTVVPILSLSTGEMIQDKAFQRVYDGFGRILKTTCFHTR